MSIGITGDTMNCNSTGHTAHRDQSGWHVSWLPGRTLTRNQAITAMALGEAAGRNPKPGDRIWAHAGAWAAELGLNGAAEAVSLARTHKPEATSRPPRKAGAGASVGELSPAGREAEAGA